MPSRLSIGSNVGAIRPVRIDVEWTAKLAISDARPIDVCIRDVSADGCKIELPVDEQVLIGETVILIIENRERVTGKITWTRGRVAGAAFCEPPPTLP